MSALKIKNVYPVGAIGPTQVPSSSSKHILSRVLQEFNATTNVSYSFASNSRIEIIISSPSSFLDYTNSYLRFKLNTSILRVAAGEQDATRALCSGGGHALIRNIEVSSSSGTTLCRIENYNKLYGSLSYLKSPRGQFDEAHMSEGDSLEYAIEEMSATPLISIVNVAAVAGTWAVVGAGGTLTITAQPLEGPLLSLVKPGDLMRFNTAAGTGFGRVTSLTSTVITFLAASDAFVQGASPLATAALVVGSSIDIFPKKTYKPTRNQAATTVDYDICLQPFLPMLQTGSYMPINLMRGGIKITIDLEDPIQALMISSGLIATLQAPSYTITSPVFVADLVQPDRELAMAYSDLWKTRGLTVIFTDWKRFQEAATSSVAPYTQTINPSFRSARMYLGFVQNDRTGTNTALTADPWKNSLYADLTEGRKSGLSQFQITSGALQFPSGRLMDTVRGSNAEVLTQAARALSKMDLIVGGYRARSDQLQSLEVVDYQYSAKGIGASAVLGNADEADSNRFYLCMDLSRDDSPFCGLDTNLNQLQVFFNFSKIERLGDLSAPGTTPGNIVASANRYINSYVAGDAMLLIQEQAGLVVMK